MNTDVIACSKAVAVDVWVNAVIIAEPAASNAITTVVNSNVNSIVIAKIDPSC